jgi:hypothetical protein
MHSATAHESRSSAENIDVNNTGGGEKPILLAEKQGPSLVGVAVSIVGDEQN